MNTKRFTVRTLSDKNGGEGKSVPVEKLLEI
jgi:hypothetical protein